MQQMLNFFLIVLALILKIYFLKTIRKTLMKIFYLQKIYVIAFFGVFIFEFSEMPPLAKRMDKKNRLRLGSRSWFKACGLA